MTIVRHALQSTQQLKIILALLDLQDWRIEQQ
jgi:hypothetical protein